MYIRLTLTRDEVQRNIPYAMICETRYGSAWDTMRRKRRWRDEFTPHERETAYRLFKFAHNWYLVSGVPETVSMDHATLELWSKLAGFCASL